MDAEAVAARRVGEEALGRVADRHALLLGILRLVQGIALAGEISGSSSMILDHALFGRRGFFSCLTLQGVQPGRIFAAAVFIPLGRFMPRDHLMSWDWRISFLLGVLVIVAGYVKCPPRDEIGGRFDDGMPTFV